MTCLPAIGSLPGSRHWLFNETIWLFQLGTWSGTSWYVPGIEGPQHPEEMYEEWTLIYVGPAGDEETPPSKMVADYFTAAISDPVARYEAITE